MRLRAFFFALGGFALIAQTLLFREFHLIAAGNELNFAVFLGAWFIAIAVGAGCARLGLERRAPADLEAGLTTCATLLALALPLQIVAIRGWRVAIGAIQPGIPLGFEDTALAMAGILLPTGLAVGAAFPWGARWALFTDAHGVGRIYAAEALGAVGGGLLFTFLLVGRLPALPIAGLASGFLLIGAALLPTRTPWGALRVATGLALFYGAVDPAFWASLDQFSTRLRWQGAGLPVLAAGPDSNRSRWIAEKDTPYQHLTLTERDGQYTLWANGEPAFVFPDPIETEHAVHLMMAPKIDARRILMIGGNPVDEPAEFLRYPVQTLTYLEPDPGVIELIRTQAPEVFRSGFGGPRMEWIASDALAWLRNPIEPYDVIWLRGDDPITLVANRYYTREFFELVRTRLAPGGMLVLAVESSEQLQGLAARRLGSIVAALDSVFQEVICLPGSPTRIWAAVQPGILTLDRDRLAEHAAQAELHTRYFQPDYLRLADELDPAKIRAVRSSLAAVSVPPNSVLLPQSCFESLRIRLHWEGAEAGLVRIAGFGERGLLELKRFIRQPFFWCAWGGVFLALSFLRRRPGFQRFWGRLSAGYAVGAMGAMGIAVELLIVVGYQNQEGVLYSRLGLLTACFMVGLTAGAELVRGVSGWRNYRPEGVVLAAWLLMALLTLVFPDIVKTGIEVGAGAWVRRWGGAFYFGLTALTGLGVGIIFPAAWQIGVAAGLKRSGSTALWDALDHLGAAAGSLTAGVLLIPVLGLDGTALILRFVAGVGVVLTLAALFWRGDP